MVMVEIFTRPSQTMTIITVHWTGNLSQSSACCYTDPFCYISIGLEGGEGGVVRPHKKKLNVDPTGKTIED